MRKISKDERVNRLYDQWKKLFRENVGEPYSPVWGRDQKLFDNLLKNHEEGTISKLMDKYFQRELKIWALPRFTCAVNDLIQEEAKEKPKKQLENPEAWRFL